MKLSCLTWGRRLPGRLAGVAASAWLVAGCAGVSGSPPALLDYQPEDFSANTHSHLFAATPQLVHGGARQGNVGVVRRALLSQGYVLEEGKVGNAQQVVGRKFFQPDANYHAQLEFRVVCAALQDKDGQPQTMAFASGLQEQYGLRRVKDSASLGVGVASLSVPLEGGHDSMVKISSRTVTRAHLYEQFFDLIGRYLPTVAAPAPATAIAPAAPVAPAQPPAASEVTKPAAAAGPAQASQ